MDHTCNTSDDLPKVGVYHPMKLNLENFDVTCVAKKA